MGMQRGRLSHQGHKEVYDYFYEIRRRNMRQFEGYWGDIADFDPRQGFRISKILYFLAKGLPNHRTGSKNQRRVGKYIKENFSIWENKALTALYGFDAKALSNAIWAMAVFGVNPSQKFMNAWHKQAKKYINIENPEKGFIQQHYANSLWALAVLQSQNPDLSLKPIYEDIRFNLNDNDLVSDTHNKQIYDSDVYFTGMSSVENPVREEITNRKEEVLKAIFRRAGFQVYKSDECPIPGLNNAIDFTVEDKQGRKVHIELDGDTHFHNPWARDLRNVKFNLHTRFRAALVNRLAPKETVTHIDFRTLMLIRKRSAVVQIAFARAAFNLSAQSGPGCYHAKLGDSDFKITDMVPKRADGTLPSFLRASAPEILLPEGVNDNGELPDHHVPQNSQLNGSHPPILAAK